MSIFLFNTLSRNKEEFISIKKDRVGLYTCGPTVYNYAHIGNLRTYLFEDLLKRTLIYNGYKVRHIMNITDVGHLTGDRDMGLDKLEEEAKKEGKDAWEISKFYEQSFWQDLEKLNILPPTKVYHATKTIKEQIELVETLEKKGYTYKTDDGIYFDSSKFPNYNKLSHQDLDALKEGARIEKNEAKKNPTDFALWKFSRPEDKRQMEWESPWGTGFPGWHIECSAMSFLGLGQGRDIHCGGIDHIDVHHTNEIAQFEAAKDEKFFNYWLHGAFLNIAGGKRMGKSENNFLTLNRAFQERNINPLVYRFAVLQTHYRKPMEYNEEIVDNAKLALDALYNRLRALGKEKGEINQIFRDEFLSAINDDLNFPEGLAILNNLLKSNLSVADKLATALDFDKVLGLDFNKVNQAIPKDIRKLFLEREKAREAKDWAKSDSLRKELENKGYRLEDNFGNSNIYKI